VSDESQLQVRPKDDKSSLILSSERSNLVARGRKDAAVLARHLSPTAIDPLVEDRRRAEAGDLYAQYKLGETYCRGKGVPRDYAEGLKWLRKAADAGSWRAAELIGILYYDGVGVSQDYAEAVKWFTFNGRGREPCGSEWSESGISEVCLGECYLYGLGVQQDYAEAARWLIEASMSELGNWGEDYSFISEFGYLLSRIYLRNEIVKLWRRTAEGEEVCASVVKETRQIAESVSSLSSFGQFCFGLWHAYGLGVPKDHTEAAKWFRRAADAGEVWAQFHLAVDYTQGRGVPQDCIQAHVWLCQFSVKWRGWVPR